MDLIERYVLEVRRLLPTSEAANVEKELRTLLGESLEARAAEAGRPVDREMVVGTLRAFGDPESVAERYNEPRYLIGPRLLPSFEYLAWIIVVVPVLVGLLGRIITVVMNDTPVLPSFEEFLDAVVTYSGRTLASLGIAVIIYAILDRQLPSNWTREDLEGAGVGWDPESLPLLPSAPLHARVTLDDVGPSFWNLTAMLVVVNTAPGLIGLPWGFNDDYRWVPVTEMGVRLPELALTLYWGGWLLHHVVLAQLGRWTTFMRWAEVGLGALGGAIVAWMLWTAEAPAGGEWAGHYEKLHRLVLLTLWFALACAVWQTIRRIVAILTPRKAAGA